MKDAVSLPEDLLICTQHMASKATSVCTGWMMAEAPWKGAAAQANPGTGADVTEQSVRGATQGTGTDTGTSHTPRTTGMALADPGAEPGSLVRGT